MGGYQSLAARFFGMRRKCRAEWANLGAGHIFALMSGVAPARCYVHRVMRALLTRVGKATEAAVRLDAAGEDLLTRRVTTVDQWIAEEEWLAGFPGNRNEHFGRLWWRGP